MTDAQKRDRMLVIARNGPIRIHVAKMPACSSCCKERKFCSSCWFRYLVARANGILPEFLRNREEQQWYFWTDSINGSTLYTFRTFREACAEIRRIFPKDENA
jgi:hypothetical protein